MRGKGTSVAISVSYRQDTHSKPLNPRLPVKRENSSNSKAVATGCVSSHLSPGSGWKAWGEQHRWGQDHGWGANSAPICPQYLFILLALEHAFLSCHTDKNCPFLHPTCSPSTLYISHLSLRGFSCRQNVHSGASAPKH